MLSLMLIDYPLNMLVDIRCRKYYDKSLKWHNVHRTERKTIIIYEYTHTVKLSFILFHNIFMALKYTAHLRKFRPSISSSVGHVIDIRTIGQFKFIPVSSLFNEMSNIETKPYIRSNICRNFLLIASNCIFLSY